MKLKPILDTLEGLDESLHELYVETDGGKFKLDIDGLESHPDVTGLVGNRDAILAEKRKLQAALDKLSGVDPEEYEALKKEAEEAERAALEKKGEFDKIMEQTVQKHQKAIEQRDARESSLRSKLEELMIDNEATKIIVSEEFKGSPTLLMPHVRKRVRVEEVDGEFRTVVLASDMSTPMVASGSGERAGLKDLIAEMREKPEFGAAFGATGGSGTGAKDTGGAGGGKKPGQIDATDRKAFSSNLEDIASGKVKVVGQQ